MKILFAHNHYGGHAIGGETMVFNSEAKLLEGNGYEVMKYERSNSEIRNMSLIKKIKAFIHIHWSEETIIVAGRIMDRFKPDILHVHNYKFLITPSIFRAAKQHGIKTVLTLHNYRLMVPCGNFMTKDGKVCERCLHKSPINILIRRCAQGSILKSFLQYRLFTKTKFELNQLLNLVDLYIVLSNFAKSKLVQSGVPEERIKVKPNFITPSSNEHDLRKNERAVFVGRLSYEKGIINLIKNWREINYPLFVVGTGPLESKARKMAQGMKNVFFTGAMDNNTVKEFLQESSILIFPSTLYEGMPMTILEAMSEGLPVIATDLGPRKEIVTDGITGFLYAPNDTKSFVNKVSLLINDKDLRLQMGKAAFADYQEKYTREANFKTLSKLYNELVK